MTKTTQVSVGSPPGSRSDPAIALPTGSLLVAMFVSVMLVAGGWSLAVWMGWGGAFDRTDFVSAMVGIGVAGVVTLAGVLMIRPWKTRPIADWMTWWLGGTVFRLLGTPAAGFLLYSAVSGALTAKPFGLSIALTYIAALFVEAAVLARHVHAASDQHSAVSQDRSS